LSLEALIFYRAQSQILSWSPRHAYQQSFAFV
jgi:hypothetical protein